MTRPVLRTERRQQPTAGSYQKLAHQKGQVSERTVGRFLSRWRNRRRVLVDARRIKRFANREHDEIKRSHDVVRMNTAFHPEVAMSKPLRGTRIDRGQKTFGR